MIKKSYNDIGSDQLSDQYKGGLMRVAQENVVSDHEAATALNG